jgi:hypothetical protein
LCDLEQCTVELWLQVQSAHIAAFVSDSLARRPDRSAPSATRSRIDPPSAAAESTATPVQ